MLHYLLSVHHPEGDNGLSPEEQAASMSDTSALNEELQESGVWVFAGGLHPPSTATVVRSVDGKIITTDGPYTETKEQLGGFWVINVDDLDAALAIAARGTVACRLAIEVRPFQG